MPDIQLDWPAIAQWASPTIAFLSFVVAFLSHRRAVHEAGLKARESEARAIETRKYAETLENFSRAAQFAQHLKGMDERAGTIAERLESLAERTGEIADRAGQITDIASTQIEKSLEHVRKATVAMEEMSRQLRDIAKTALAAQRQALDSGTPPGRA